MQTLDEFVRNHPQLQDEEPPTERLTSDRNASVSLTGILLSVSDETVTFAHLGHKFDIERSAVLGVASSSSAVPNPFNRGQTVEISLGLGAKLRPHGTVRAEALSAGVPFAIAQPSEIDANDFPFHTAAELAWLAENNIEQESKPLSSVSGTYCGHNTTSPKWSSTFSNNREDDGKGDEYYGDDASHDDTGADD